MKSQKPIFLGACLVMVIAGGVIGAVAFSGGQSTCRVVTR